MKDQSWNTSVVPQDEIIMKQWSNAIDESQFTADQLQRASDMCESVYDSDGAEAFNACREKQLEKMRRKTSIWGALGEIGGGILTSFGSGQGQGGFGNQPPPPPRRQGGSGGWIALGVIGGLAIVGAIVYSVVKNKEED